MKKKSVITIFVLIVSAAVAIAQEKPALEEILRWFPEGRYIEIVHFDKEAYISNCSEDVFENYIQPGNRLFPLEREFLPSSLAGRYVTETRASLGKLGIKNCDYINEDGELVPLNRKSTLVFEANGRKYGGWTMTRSLRVYRIPELNYLLRQAIKTGEVGKINVSIDNRPVYTFSAKTNINKESYGYATLTQEFLVVSELDDLKDMVRAGLAYDMPVFQKLDPRPLIDVSSRPSYLWSYSSRAYFFQMVNDYLLIKDPESPSLETVREKMETDVQFIIDACRWDRESNRVQNSTSFYSDEEGAKEKYDQLKQNKSKYFNLNFILNKTFINGIEITFRDSLIEINEERAQRDDKNLLELDGASVIETRIDNKESLIKSFEVLNKKADKSDSRKNAI